MKTRILAIDPGLALVGWAVVDYDDDTHDAELMDCGVIKTPANLCDTERLLLIEEDLGELVNDFKPDCAVVERLFIGRNISTAIMVGQARGVILALLGRKLLPLSEYTPNQAKACVTGKVRAEKWLVQQSIQDLFKLKKKLTPDDAADACALAITHIHSSLLGASR